MMQLTTNPFDYVNSILLDKKIKMRGTENDQLMEAGFNPWLTNNALSYHEDTILIANIVNQYHQLPKRAQYELLMATVRPKRRQFKKWAKTVEDSDLALICEVYNCNKQVGQQYLSILSPEQVAIIGESRSTGGTTK